MELKSEDSVSENRVQALEEFANNLAEDESFSQIVLEKILDDPSYYNKFLKPLK